MATAEQRLGRKRDGRVDHAIVVATRELLISGGYAPLTVDAVATRAGVGKAAIYRRYATKPEMVFAAAVHDVSIGPPADSGSLRGDLTALLADVVASLANSAAFAAIPALIADLTTDPAVAARFQDTFIAGQQACLTEILDRAESRGELRSRPDLAEAHVTVVGPVFAWLFLLRQGDAEGFAVDHAARLAAAWGG